MLITTTVTVSFDFKKDADLLRKFRETKTDDWIENKEPCTVGTTFEKHETLFVMNREENTDGDSV